jgi:hypothetical protein
LKEEKQIINELMVKEIYNLENGFLKMNKNKLPLTRG